MKKRIAILDLDSICYTIGHGNKITMPDGSFKREGARLVYEEKTKEQLVDSANKVMNDILRNCNATHYIGYMKGERTSDFRKNVNPSYKANRSDTPPVWWDFVQSVLFFDLKSHFVNDIEVDDAVNITRLKLEDSFIVAIDKDLLSLPGTHYNWRTNEWVTVDKETAAIKFWTDMIAGQVGDNVKGIPGKGEVFASRLFEAKNGPYHSIVFNAYCDTLGVHGGIVEFWKNYHSLRILEDHPTFSIPEPVAVPNIKQTPQEEIPL